MAGLPCARSSRIKRILVTAVISSCFTVIALTDLRDAEAGQLPRGFKTRDMKLISLGDQHSTSRAVATSTEAPGLNPAPLSVHAYTPRFFLLGAYDDSRSGSRRIWVTAFGHRDSRGVMYCQFGPVRSAARGRWIHFTNRTVAVWRAALVSCPAPVGARLHSVTVVGAGGGTAGVALPIRGEYDLPRGEKEFLGVCVKGGYGSPDGVRFVEWMELNRLLGVDHVFLYDAGMTGAIGDVFRHYVGRGWLTTIRDDSRSELGRRVPHLASAFRQFDATFSTGSEPHAQTQLLSLQDCLHRFRGAFEYIMVIDIDEVLVPTEAATLVDLLTRLRDAYPTSTAFSFPAAEYVAQFGAASGGPADAAHALKYTRRTALSFEQVKTVHFTGDTVAVNWHRRLWPETNFTAVPPTHAWLHHYRARCKSRRCLGGYVTDDGSTKLGRYATALTAGVRSTLEALAPSW